MFSKVSFLVFILFVQGSLVLGQDAEQTQEQQTPQPEQQTPQQEQQTPQQQEQQTPQQQQQQPQQQQQQQQQQQPQQQQQQQQQQTPSTSSFVPQGMTAAQMWNPYTWITPFYAAASNAWTEYLQKAQEASTQLYQQWEKTGAGNIFGTGMQTAQQAASQAQKEAQTAANQVSSLAG